MCICVCCVCESVDSIFLAISQCPREPKVISTRESYRVTLLHEGIRLSQIQVNEWVVLLWSVPLFV